MTPSRPPSSEPLIRSRRRGRRRSIGTRLRTQQGLTLAQIAARAAIDVSTLSRLESGKRRLALDHVPALAAALGVTADDLLGGPAAQDPRVRGRPQRYAGLTIWPLTRRCASGLHAHKVLVSPSRRMPPDPLPVHKGHDWIYVLAGRMRLLLGDADLVIAPGEVVEFTTWTPHWFGAIDEAVEMILILGPEGAYEHLHREQSSCPTPVRSPLFESEVSRYVSAPGGDWSLFAPTGVLVGLLRGLGGSGVHEHVQHFTDRMLAGDSFWQGQTKLDAVAVTAASVITSLENISRNCLLFCELRVSVSDRGPEGAGT